MIALCSLAPFRLGLSATVERIDGKEEMIYNLIGPQVYRGHIAELEAKTLAPYQIVQIQVQMTPDEWEAYSEARTIYRDFVRRNQISFASPQGWGRFLIAVARAPDGRKAMTAYREQKRLAQSSQSKVTELWRIVRDHKGERMIVFTDENAMAYDIGREFFIPVITYHTKAKERVRILDDFRAGRITMIATSKVLNEGVDVPEASVGVVISGSGTVREHVQRLGRILRHKEGKTAVLYEVISRGTNEEYTNERRRQHSAYQRPSAVYQS